MSCSSMDITLQPFEDNEVVEVEKVVGMMFKSWEEVHQWVMARDESKFELWRIRFVRGGLVS